jgi:hypothetical protein
MPWSACCWLASLLFSHLEWARRECLSPLTADAAQANDAKRHNSRWAGHRVMGVGWDASMPRPVAFLIRDLLPTALDVCWADSC